MITPQPLEQIGIGLAASISAALLNLFVARHLLSGSKQYRSITLEADAHHLMTDVWTSAGVVAGIAVVAVTGWTRFDAVIALCVAVNNLWTGVPLLPRSLFGLLDTSLGAAEQDRIKQILNRYGDKNIYYHALRTRQRGRLFHSTCSCRQNGLCSAGMIWSNDWSAIYARRFPAQPCLLTSSRSMTQQLGRT